MEDLIIKAQDGATKGTFELFIDNYKDQIVQFIANVLRSEGAEADPALIKDEETGQYTIYRTAPDKGWVLSNNGATEASPLVAQLYSTIPSGSKYVLFDGDKLALFLREEDGQPDIKIGKFPDLNHAFLNIESGDVNMAVEKALERKIAAQKVEDDINRKAKVKALSRNEKEVTTKQD